MSHYIKVEDPSSDNLLSKFDTEINPTVRCYVLNSWYNYWSSVLIENIFKSNPAVSPTVGKVKSVDFFIHDIPFDLKVTYLPSEYIKQKRKENGFSVELTYLKRKAKEAGITFAEESAPAEIEHEITEKLKDRDDVFSKETLAKLKAENLEILHDTQTSPNKLAKWLYENQGEMRFGSENRISLVLVDSENFEDSWKLKRNLDLLKSAIETYLSNFSTKRVEDFQVTFEFKGKPAPFTALADVLFIVK